MKQGMRCSSPIVQPIVPGVARGAYSGRTISATRSVIVIESTQSLKASSRSVSDRRTWGHGESCSRLAVWRVSCLVVVIKPTRGECSSDVQHRKAARPEVHANAVGLRHFGWALPVHGH